MKRRNITSISQEIIDSINEELSYVDGLTGHGRADDEDHGVEGQLLTLGHYTRRARAAWVENVGSQKALDELRKCAAIAIRALELYGCPKRGSNA